VTWAYRVNVLDLEPHGPLAPEIYWRRRGLALGIAVVVIGIVIGLVAIVGAIRLAKPGSWWAVHRYASRPRRAARARRRYDQRYQERWNRLRDLVAGAPSRE